MLQGYLLDEMFDDMISDVKVTRINVIIGLSKYKKSNYNN